MKNNRERYKSLFHHHRSWLHDRLVLEWDIWETETEDAFAIFSIIEIYISLLYVITQRKWMRLPSPVPYGFLFLCSISCYSHEKEQRSINFFVSFTQAAFWFGWWYYYLLSTDIAHPRINCLYSDDGNWVEVVPLHIERRSRFGNGMGLS